MSTIALTNNLPAKIKADLITALTVLDLSIPSDYSAGYIALVASRKIKENK